MNVFFTIVVPRAGRAVPWCGSWRVGGVVAVALFAMGGQATAQTSGTWTALNSGNASGTWSTGANWSGGAIANGVGATADFSTLNITVTSTVTLNANQTVGTLRAGDATTASHNWAFNASASGTLTLAATGTTPAFDILHTRTATINAPVAGTQGFRKTGNGTVSLTNASNASLLSGDVRLEQGTLSVTSLEAFGSGAVILGNNNVATSTLSLAVSAGSTIAKNFVVDVNGSAYAPQISLTGSSTWSGTVTVNNYNGTSLRNLSFAGTADNSRLNPEIFWSSTGSITNKNVTLGRGLYGGKADLGAGELSVVLGSSAKATLLSDQWLFGSFAASTSSLGSVVEMGVKNFFRGKKVSLGANATNRSLSIDLNGYDQDIGGAVLDFGFDTASITNSNSGTQALLTLSGTGSTSLVNGAYSGRILGNLALRKIGTGTQTLGGVNTYTGNTTIDGGVLKLDSAATIATTPLIIVGGTGSSGAVLDLTAKTGTFTFGPTQTVKGIGTINIGAGKTVALAGTLAPGNSPGQLNVTGDVAWAAGGLYEWEITNATGTAGSQWDLLSVSGVLDLSALDSTNKYFLDVITLDPSNTPGAMANYVNGTSYTWRIADASSVLLSSGAAAGGTLLTSLFNVSFDGWQNGAAPSSYDIRVAAGGGGIELVIVPEPAGLVGSAMGFLILGWRARVGRRAARRFVR